MSMKYAVEAYELLDDPNASGAAVKEALIAAGADDFAVEVKRVKGPKGHTDFVKAWFQGTEGKKSGGTAPTLGIVGRLGGIGARPERIGLVSDADGAVAAIGIALKLGRMARLGDRLKGDVFISTHICPNAPTQPREPVAFMGSPISMEIANAEEISESLDAVLSIDTTRGNHIVNHRGFAISPTVKEGYILRVSEDLLTLMGYATGKPPVVFAVTMQDITPYGNDLYHLNSILQPATATKAPVVGVALTSETAVPGCATGASNVVDIEAVLRFSIETAKAFGAGKVKFYDESEYARLLDLYGSMARLQTLGGR